MDVIDTSRIINMLTQPDAYRQIAESEDTRVAFKENGSKPEKLLIAERKQRILAETLHRASIALSGTLNYEEVLDRTLEQAKLLIPHDAASIMLVDDEVARSCRWRGYNQFRNKGDIVPLKFNIAATPTLSTMQASRRPLVIPYAEEDDQWIKMPEGNWIKSYIGAPICIRDHTIGFLNLNSATPGSFGQSEVEPLQSLAELAAIALKNAQLYDQGRQEVIARVRALKRERNFISAVLDTAGALVMVLNRQGRIIRFNRACQKTTGYSFEEVRGKYWWDLFLPQEEIEPIKTAFEQMCIDQSPRRYESHWITKEGRKRFIAWSNTILRDHNEAVEYVLHTGIDLTKRKEAEQALQSSEERFQGVILSISDHVYVTEVTPEGDRLNLYISPHIEALTAYPIEKFTTDWSFWPSRVIHPDDQASAAVQAAKLAQGQNSEMEYRLVRANGDIIWVRDSARVKSYGPSKIVYGVVSDITERKRSEDKLKATNQQLKTLTSRLQEELMLAQKIQQGLLPAGRPAWTGLELACHSVPAREVGGDFYAYHAFEDSQAIQRFAIAIGDVSGKGMPAALLMATSLTALQSAISHTSDPNHLLTELDLALEPYTRTTLQNCALCCAEITRSAASSEKWLMRVANAGCVTPLICRSNGAVEWVEVGGIPLGVGVDTEGGYTEAISTLNKGDLVIFTSDGVIEATNAVGTLFGFDRFEQSVTSGPKTSATAMLAHLQAEVTNHTGNIEPHDDMTIVVLHV